ncbi:hypothetical protein BC89_30525 [Pseudomonas monteilii]|uniref:hypothetical protein n=1 Tax=Pseudomonas TaxID=286 RepID=UPI00077492DC|nr:MULTISPECIES: hypothetical protein [Pseudomonas]KXK67606.1 hypothetical protein BC89_30525 [Pseudomonas monteilii]OAS07657.1 hypothetical protein AYO08_09975 [Pseudomonas putida]OOV96746.1 hypothetical protein MF6396_20830 [Pseudomonas sp. MF6396]
MANRKTCTDSASNEAALLEVFANNTFRRVIFFASPDEGGSRSDGSESNWPLMAVLVEDQAGDLGVYDGDFLTATRYPRYLEVKTVLDAAQASKGTVLYAKAPLPFTSGKSPEAAAQDMLSVQTDVFDQSTRANYFKLLSRLTEKQYAQTYD